MLRFGMLRNVGRSGRCRPFTSSKLTKISLRATIQVPRATFQVSRRWFQSACLTASPKAHCAIPPVNAAAPAGTLENKELKESNVYQDRSGGDQDEPKHWTFKNYFASNGHYVVSGIGMGTFTGVTLKCYLDEYATDGSVIWMGLLCGFIGGICGLSPHMFIISLALTGSIVASITVARILWPRKKYNYGLAP